MTEPKLATATDAEWRQYYEDKCRKQRKEIDALKESFTLAATVNEALAKKYREEIRTSADGSPEGTRESLERCATMLDTYGPDCFPANELGQIHFARSIMESVADEIRAFFAKAEPTP